MEIEISEQNLEDLVCDIYKEGLLDNYLDDFFTEYPFTYKRQLRLGKYGCLDLLFVEKFYEPDGDKKFHPFLRFHLFELKSRPAKGEDIVQLARYYSAIREFLWIKHCDKDHYEVVPHLLYKGQEGSLPEAAFIVNMSDVNFWEYSFDYGGLGINRVEGCYKENAFSNED